MVGTSRTGRLLRRLVRLSCRRPVLTTLLSLIPAIAGTADTLHALTFKTSGHDLLPKDAGYVVRYNQFAHEFGELEDIVIVVGARTCSPLGRSSTMHCLSGCISRGSETKSPPDA